MAGDDLSEWIEYLAYVFGVAAAGLAAENLYLHSDGTLSFATPDGDAGSAPYRQYTSDPANPVRTGSGRFRRLIRGRLADMGGG